MAKYRNPWHKPHNDAYGPAFYQTDAKPIAHAGHLLYQRIPGPVGRCCWDVVKDGVCIAQRAGRDGAMRAAETMAARAEAA